MDLCLLGVMVNGKLFAFFLVLMTHIARTIITIIIIIVIIIMIMIMITIMIINNNTIKIVTEVTCTF